MSERAARARRALVAACLQYEAGWLYDTDHPENPHGDAEMDLYEEMLDAAARAYVAELEGLRREEAP